MNKVLTLGEAIADMLLHANTPLAVAYRKRMAAERVSETNAHAEAIASVELHKDHTFLERPTIVFYKIN